MIHYVIDYLYTTVNTRAHVCVCVHARQKDRPIQLNGWVDKVYCRSAGPSQ